MQLFYTFPPLFLATALLCSCAKHPKTQQTPEDQEMPSHPPPQRRFLPPQLAAWHWFGVPPLAPSPMQPPALPGCARDAAKVMRHMG